MTRGFPVSYVYPLRGVAGLCRDTSRLWRVQCIVWRAEVWTRDSLTASLHATDWATPHPAKLAAPYWASSHPAELRRSLLCYAAPLLRYAALYWATPHPTEQHPTLTELRRILRKILQRTVYCPRRSLKTTKGQILTSESEASYWLLLAKK
jgi:hypothetical protein